MSVHPKFANARSAGVANLSFDHLRHTAVAPPTLGFPFTPPAARASMQPHDRRYRHEAPS